MRFEFATATRIIFGGGTVREVGPLAAEMGGRAFVVTGRTFERAAPVLEGLRERKIEYTTFSVAGEPTTTIVNEGLEPARVAGSDLVISIGGGSVLDAGKAIAAMLTNPGDLSDYLEVVGLGTHNGPDDSGYRGRGDAQRGPERAGAEGQGQYAKRAYAACRGRG